MTPDRKAPDIVEPAPDTAPREAPEAAQQPRVPEAAEPAPEAPISTSAPEPEPEDHERKVQLDLDELAARAEKADEYLELALRT